MMRKFVVVMVFLALLPFYCFVYSQEAVVAFSWFSFPRQSDNLLVANFTYSPNDVTVNQVVHFYDHSSGTIARWLWNFGDGATANTTVRENKTHVYATLGNYLVSLTVFDDFGNSSFVEAVILVRKVNTTLSLGLPDSVPQGASFTLMAVLKDEYDSPVDGVAVSFFVVDGLSESSVGFGLTDPIGRASISYTPQGSGALQFRAVFNGTDVYAGASSGLKIVQVGYDLVPYAVLGSVLVLIMSAALAYVRLKRRREEESEEEPSPEEDEKEKEEEE